MKTVLKVLFIIGMIVYAYGIAYYPDKSEQQLFTTLMFGFSLLGFILVAIPTGKRKVKL